MSDEQMSFKHISFGPGDPTPHCKTTAEFLKAVQEFERDTQWEPSLANPPDRLEEMFRRQKELMNDLILADKLPEAPVDISSKQGQRQLKELFNAMMEELFEASYTLKNRPHRITDHREVDFPHFKEELADALAYFIEVLVFADIGPDELFEEFCKKNATVRGRVADGY
jgi:hypothetical protein